MSVSMIERVARSICRKNAMLEHGVADETGWIGWIDHASAAIAAMREPSRWMILQANRKAAEVQELTLGPEETWLTMIDAALTDDQSGR